MTHPTLGIGFITSRYLAPNRTDAYGNKNHFGTDISAPTGTPVYACKSGKVVVAFKGCVTGDLNCGNAGGNYVQIDHGSGLQSQYLHLIRNVVSKGDRVKEGELIGYVGSTGYSTGAHLHFSLLRNNVFINPEPYLAQSSTKPKKKSEKENSVLPFLIIGILIL
jgi:murein DD-endopeptidase MepM/ murein hydrolase activator NlpD